MADYTEDQISAYNDIAEAGGKIWFRRDQNPQPDDPNLPWQGTDQDSIVEVEHVAVFFPLTENVSTVDTNPFAESCLIPAHKLDFEIGIGTTFRKANDQVLVVVNMIPLRPDGVNIIIYTCEVNTWPGT